MIIHVLFIYDQQTDKKNHVSIFFNVLKFSHFIAQPCTTKLLCKIL